jgi:phosphoadenosine phosphosulfate reductase
MELLNQQWAGQPSEQLLAWATREFGGRVAFACSFGAEDVVVLHLLLKARPDARVFVLDTGRLPPETYEAIERSRERYGRDFEFFYPDCVALQEFTNREGPNPFYRSVELRKACCHIRKVEPLGRALAGMAAWVTGLRRGQAVTRQAIPRFEMDEVHGGILKINPVVDWSDAQVWEHIRAHRLPYNVLHDRGYPSIGCALCTRAIRPGEDIRAGRWWWEEPEHKECGLHVKNGKAVRNQHPHADLVSDPRPAT